MGQPAFPKPSVTPSMAESREAVELCGPAELAWPAELPPVDVILGRSRAMLAVRQRVDRLRLTSVPVLIVGESGTGKEFVAQLIHTLSPRRRGPFVKINCAAFDGVAVERELFGYCCSNAATGTLVPSIERVQGGTLFLDDVTALDVHVQARLFHALQKGWFTHGTNPQPVDCRVICSTARNLKQDVANGRFRQDLYYAINVLCIELPPLRTRREDIPIIVEYLRDRCAAETGCSVVPLTPEFTELLTGRDWPGNIRELDKLIRRYIILGCDETAIQEVRAAQTTTGGAHGDKGVSLKARTREAVREIERQILLEVLQSNNWNRKETARSLNISYRSLFHKLKTAGLPPKRGRVGMKQPNSQTTKTD